MITIRTERPVDESAREALLDLAYGVIRHSKPSARLRTGRLPADALALVAIERGRMLGTVRLWNIRAGGRDALLLGPLAVHPEARNRGIGSALMRQALAEAASRGHAAVILVGDEAYYGRFGFTAATTAGLRLSTACDPARLLACELKPGALDGVRGTMQASGRHIPMPALAGLAALTRKGRLVPRAA